MKLENPRIYKIVVALCVPVLFCIDLFIPLGLIIWLFYIPIIFISVVFEERKFTFWIGIASSICILASYLVSIIFQIGVAELVEWWISLSNRMLGVIVISILIYLTCKYLESKENNIVLEKLIRVCAWTKRICIQGEWITIEEFFKRYMDKDVTHGASPEVLASFLDECEMEEKSTDKKSSPKINYENF